MLLTYQLNIILVEVRLFPLPTSLIDLHVVTVDGDQGPSPILHISLMRLPIILEGDDWAPTELIDSDSDESLSSRSNVDMSDFADELKEIADNMQQPTIAANRRPLGV